MSKIDWGRYQKVRENLDNPPHDAEVTLDDAVIHEAALQAAQSSCKGIRLSLHYRTALSRTLRKQSSKHEIPLTVLATQVAWTTGHAEKSSDDEKDTLNEEDLYSVFAADRYDTPTDELAVHELLCKVTKDWGDYPVSLEDAAEMKYPGKDAPKSEKALYNRTKQRLDYFRRKWRENGTH